MAIEAILAEVDQLNQTGDRIEALAENHPIVEEALITIAGNVRGSATILALLVETKLRGGDGHARLPSTKPV